MIENPVKNLFIFDFTCSNPATEVYQFVICAFDPDSVHLKENKHDIYSNPFVAINKSMVGDQGAPQHCSFFFLCGVFMNDETEYWKYYQ